jgi:opacity protein-like surface antigen
MLKSIISAIVLLAAVGPASAQDWTVDVYGGIGGDGTLAWDGDDYETGNGKAFGIGVYNTAVLDGFAIGLDVMHSGTDYTGYSDSIAATSVMLAGRYAFPINDQLSATFGAGIGAMAVSYDVGVEKNGFSNGSATVVGGQAEVGLRYQVQNGPTVFGAIKYQSPFDDVEFDDGLVAEYDSTSALFGISFRM